MRDYETPLTIERINKTLIYHRDKGIFIRKNRRGRCGAGEEAGTVGTGGYIVIFIDTFSYRAHRLVWLMETGKWPMEEIDHINGVRSDNRITNLREASPLQNSRNAARARANTSGFKGVSFYKLDRKWTARIQVEGRSVFLGYHKTAEAASEAYKSAADKYFGEFARY